jgi:hypothetical protein
MPKHTDQALVNSNPIHIAGPTIRCARLQPNSWIAIDPIPGHYINPRSICHFSRKLASAPHWGASSTELLLAKIQSELIQSP